MLQAYPIHNLRRITIRELVEPLLNPKKEHARVVFKVKVTEDLFLDLDEEPKGTVSAEQQALADAEEKVTAADAKRSELREYVKYLR